MKNQKIKSATFSNKRREIEIEYNSGKKVSVHYASLNLAKNIKAVRVDQETNGRSLEIEFMDGTLDYMPYDQPLAIAQDPEFMLQNHIENVIAQIKEEMVNKKISKKYLARQLETSDNQIQRLLNPDILNKNLVQLYKLASLLGLQFEINLMAA